MRTNRSALFAAIVVGVVLCGASAVADKPPPPDWGAAGTSGADAAQALGPPGENVPGRGGGEVHEGDLEAASTDVLQGTQEDGYASGGAGGG